MPESGETESFTNVQGIVVQFVAPIKLHNDNTVIYYDPGEEFRASFGVMELPIKVYSAPNVNKEQSIGSLRFLPSKESYLMDVTVTKIDANKIFIERKDLSIFDPNNVVMIEWALDDKGSSYATGFYTDYP